MIFTPEESREIAEKMLGWVYQPNTLYNVGLGRIDEEGWYNHDGEPRNRLPDFSLTEWTGPILEKVLTYGDECNTVAFSPGGAVWWTRRGQNVLVFDYGNRNLNLFHLWKWLRERKEASNVRPE